MTEPLQITVVIPTLNEAAHLPNLLACLAEAGETLPLIISDGGSADGTEDIARAAGARVITGPPGRGGQLSRGIAASSTPWLLLLHADTLFSPGWQETLRQTLSSASAACAYYGKLCFASADPRARVLECGVALRCALWRLPYGDQALLIHSDLLAAIGGMPDAPLMEDVLLARRLGRARLAPMHLPLTTDA
ncbi:MAG TPA: glycosyltransferase, partial [Acidocella sp.]|nr:glycosyltransferase [Acidocella sp.]